jgi:hypothetical protein
MLEEDGLLCILGKFRVCLQTCGVFSGHDIHVFFQYSKWLMAGRVAQVVAHLPSKQEALSLNPCTAKNKTKPQNKRNSKWFMTQRTSRTVLL